MTNSTRNMQQYRSGQAITQHTVLELHILVLFHVLSIKLYYFFRCVTYGLEMRALFFLIENISSKLYTQNMNSIYLQDRKGVHNASNRKN